MKAVTEERELAAIHEAAHVVIARAGGLVVSNVRVSLDGTGNFHFEWPVPPAEMTPADRCHLARATAKTAIAGLLAESLLSDSVDRFIHRVDALCSGIDGVYVARIKRSGSDVDLFKAYAAEVDGPEDELVRECAVNLEADCLPLQALVNAILAKWIPGESEVHLNADELEAALKEGTD